MIRVLVAEDSVTARRLLVEMLSSDPGIQVVGEARDGLEAVELADRLDPDVITMDVQMPKLDGLEATRRIMAKAPKPIIIVSAQANAREVSLSLEATRAGAVLVLPKPEGPASDSYVSQRAQLVAMVKAMADVKVVRRWFGKPAAAAPHTHFRARPGASKPLVVAIGASAGGPPALRELFSALPSNFPLPILLVQHIATGFVQGLTQWLDGDTKLHVVTAVEGMRLENGFVYVAPDDRHLGIRRQMDQLFVSLSSSPPVGAFRPSATWMFESAARAVGSGLVAVIMTGMGDDGVEGLKVVHAAGGQVLAQDEATCLVYGMPREAVRAGVVDVVLPLADLAPFLTQLGQFA